MEKAVYVGVIGPGECDKETSCTAYRLGEGIAGLGAVLVCGGRSGVMEAAAKGARAAGGTVIGILPGDDPRGGNSFLSFAVATGLGDARNAVIARTCDVLVAVAGGYGTLSEIGLALKMGKPVIGLKTWRCIAYSGENAALWHVESVAEALSLCSEIVARIRAE